MKLLMITRKVDKVDGLAGFTYNWVSKLALHLEQLYVICLERGNISDLPANVQIFSLGKEKGNSRWQEFSNFQKYARKIVPQVDGVFSHQNPEYGILIAPWTKLFRKKLVVWYAHGSVSFKLRLLNFLATKIVTSTTSGFKLKSNKLTILQQGIDTELFNFKPQTSVETVKLLTVGRISSTKNVHLMIDLLKPLQAILNKKVVLDIVGEPSLDRDREYYDQLKDQIKRFGLEKSVNFLGSVSNVKTPALYQQADVFLNFSQTASLDKTILEAMSCGTLVLTSNESAYKMLPQELTFVKFEPATIATKILHLINLPDDIKMQLTDKLRNIVVENHSLDELVKKIVLQFK